MRALAKLAAALLLAAQASAASMLDAIAVGAGSGAASAAIGAPLVLAGGGGGGGNVVARIDCRSFGQTAQEGGVLNILYATPIMCWATRSTVSGTAINVTGWVPETFVHWDWDDNSLGSVTRGGVSMDLGESFGLVAAHAFRPSAFAESCNGGTNSAHTVRATVYSVVAGVRESATATLSACVTNPATTWPAPVAFCDDDDCADDPGVPAGTVHGGNGTALNTILRYCLDHGSTRVLLEQNVTFTSAVTGTTTGSNACLIESYGGGRATMQFTAAPGSGSSVISPAACPGGFRIFNVAVKGADTRARFVGPNTQNQGCVLLLDIVASTAVGEGMQSITTNDPSPGDAVASEIYYVLLDWRRFSTPGTTVLYVWADYFALIGSDVENPGEHIIRTPQNHYGVIDANKFDGQNSGNSLVTYRHDCNGTTSCPTYPDAGIMAASRNELHISAGGTAPFQLMASGSGSDQQTKNYDIDFIRNICMKDSLSNQPKECFTINSATAGAEIKRIRWIQNLTATEFFDSSSYSHAIHIESGPAASDWYFGGNVVWGSALNQPMSLFGGSSAISNLTERCNVCAETGSGSCDLFSGVTEDATSRNLASDPFDRTGTPASGDSLVFGDFLITNSNTSLKGLCSVRPYPTDIESESVPQSSDYDIGIDDE